MTSSCSSRSRPTIFPSSLFILYIYIYTVFIYIYIFYSLFILFFMCQPCSCWPLILFDSCLLPSFYTTRGWSKDRNCRVIGKSKIKKRRPTKSCRISWEGRNVVHHCYLWSHTRRALGIIDRFSIGWCRLFSRYSGLEFIQVTADCVASGRVMDQQSPLHSSFLVPIWPLSLPIKETNKTSSQNKTFSSNFWLKFFFVCYPEVVIG